jgi:ATP-dependent helicase/nuclease subunit A
VSEELESLRREDAAARALAQREFERPLVLEAGAGTGKTATLVARIVAWCLGIGWERAAEVSSSDEEVDEGRLAARVLGGVVAITFTEAAAAEMATRVESALAAIEMGDLPRGVDPEALPAAPLRNDRAAALRGALDHLVVHTLHAYARRLLAARPFEAGVHPHLEVDAEGHVQKRVVREQVAAALADAYARDGDAVVLGEEGYGPQELEAELLALSKEGVRARDLGPDLVSRERLAALLGRIGEALDDFTRASEGRLAATPKRSRITLDTTDAIDLTRRRLPAEDASAADLRGALTQLAELWSDSSLARLKAWSKGAFNKGETAALDGLEAETAAAAKALRLRLAHGVALDPEHLERAARVVAPILAEVERELHRRGSASFASLLSDAADLLVNRPDVAAMLRRDIDQMLVDEFQDTDPLQCAIVGALALGGEPAERPGLFIVGDPKQSIYGWRSADLAAYEGFRDRVVASGGQVQRLSVNHRSVPAVLDEVVRAVAPVMIREPGVQPDFERLVPSLENAEREGPSDDRIAPVEYWISAPWNADSQDFEAGRASDANDLEAKSLAADLRALHDERGVDWGSVALLFRSRGDWDVYLGALREAGVPFVVEGDRSYFRRREIIDAAAFVRCVLDPNDQIALVAFLRSVCVGVPDAAWIPLWAIDFPDRVGRLEGADPESLALLARDVRQVASELPPGVPGLERVAGWEENLVAALEALGALRLSFERDAADVFVEKLRGALLFEATEAARFLGPWRAANLDRFFLDLARDLAGGADTPEVLRRLADAVAEEEPMGEEPSHEIGLDAVQILTFHGAKGLDFDHVYLVQLHKGTGGFLGPRIDAARVDGVLELRLLGIPTPGFDRAEERRERVAEAERVRLLYVGMTRARERLVLSGAWSSVSRRGSGTFTELLARRRDVPDAREVAARALAAGVAHVDTTGARFVVPGLRDDAPAERAAAPGPLDEGAEGFERASRRLARQIEEAEARMARPLGGRASEAGHEDGSEERAERIVEAGGIGPQPGRDAEVARLAGIAVHRVFEELDLDAPLGPALEESGEGVEEMLRAHGEPGAVNRAARAARELLGALAGGQLLARFEAIRGHVVARELPVLLPAGEDDLALAFVAGAVDLVYRDPDSDELVIVDYKTDVLEGDAALEARAGEYAAQGAVYQRALQDGLGLEHTPRFDLWFLAADRCITPTAASESTGPAQLDLTLAPSQE